MALADSPGGSTSANPQVRITRSVVVSRRSKEPRHTAGSPYHGVTSYSTVGLSDVPLLVDGKEFPARVELVGACDSSTGAFANVLTTAAFFVINTGWVPRPGGVFPGILDMHNASPTMRNLLFVPPFLWNPNLETLKLSDRTVAWLQEVPISDAELRFAREQGSEALEDKFVEAQIDVFDIGRSSVIAQVRQPNL